MTDPKPLSFLDLVERCDVFRPGAPSQDFADEELLPFHLNPAPDSPKIGLLRPVIVDALYKENESKGEGQKLWEFLSSPRRVSLSRTLDTPAKRSRRCANLLSGGATRRNSRMFAARESGEESSIRE